jgi:hypothetical protein
MPSVRRRCENTAAATANGTDETKSRKAPSSRAVLWSLAYWSTSMLEASGRGVLALEATAARGSTV